MKSRRKRNHIPGDPSKAFASMGIYLFRTKSPARGLDCRRPGKHGARFRQEHHSPNDRLPPRLRLSTFTMPTKKPSNTGETSERSTPTGKPISISWRWTRYSISTTSNGRSAPIRGNFRRRNSSSRRIIRAAAWGWRWIQSSAEAALSPEAGCKTRVLSPNVACPGPCGRARIRDHGKCGDRRTLPDQTGHHRQGRGSSRPTPKSATTARPMPNAFTVTESGIVVISKGMKLHASLDSSG